jgi:two-component sensor histidine kinase
MPETTINLLAEINSLSKIHTLKRHDIDAMMVEFAKRILVTLRIERMSVWLFNKKKNAVISMGEYDLSSNSFSKDHILEKKKFPIYFKSINDNEILLAPNIYKNPNTIELSEDYSLPNGIISLMDIPLRIAGELVGVMCFEKKGTKERIFSKNEQVFALSTATVFASTLEARYRRALQAKLDKELKEKNLLIKEIHHRVKNNLAIVSSLLHLQSNKSKDTFHKKLFEECMSKVDSIAGIHDLIYRTKSFAEISTKDYFNDMLQNIAQLHANRENKIKLNIKIKDFLLQIEKALPLALLVNEVMTNIYKHAFDSKKSAAITFSLTTKGKNLQLTISDNGKGFKAQIGKINSLGLDIIDGLAEKLNAVYTYGKGETEGTVFNLDCAFKNGNALKKKLESA